jgi:hypothetical protein
VKRILYVISCLLVLMMAFALPVLAVTYTGTITISETAGTAYTQKGWQVLVDNATLATNGFILPSGLDVQVLDGGALVPSMIVSDRTMFATTLPASTNKNLQYTFGNAPAAAMQIVTGIGGYATTVDTAALEPGTDWSFEVKGTFDLSGNVASTPIVAKNGVTLATATDAFRIQTAEAGVIVAEHFGTVTTDQQDVTLLATATIGGAVWLAQTFTTGAAYRVASVQLNIGGITATPGPITVAIYNAIGDLPTGLPLSSCTVPQARITASGGLATRNYFYLPPIALLNATQYAIVISAPTAPVGSLYTLYHDDTNSYAGGRQCTSADSGTTWAGAAGNDEVFVVQYATYVVATGVTPVNHLITVTQESVGPTYTIYIDGGAPVQQIAYGTAVLNNASVWVWAGQPSYDYIKEHVGVPEVLRYEPNTIVIGTALIDRDLTQNGVITFGGTATGVTTYMGPALVPSGYAALPSTGGSQNPTFGGVSPGTGSSSTGSGTTGSTFPFYDFFKGLVDNFNAPHPETVGYTPPTMTMGWFWMVVAAVLDVMALIIVSRTGSMMIIGGTGLALLSIQCGLNIFEWWVLILYIIFAATFWIFQRVQSVGG